MFFKIPADYSLTYNIKIYISYILHAHIIITYLRMPAWNTPISLLQIKENIQYDTYM